MRREEDIKVIVMDVSRRKRREEGLKWRRVDSIKDDDGEGIIGQRSTSPGCLEATNLKHRPPHKNGET